MELPLYTGKILAGGAVAAAGTGGVVLYVKNPEWFTSSKTSESEQPTTPSWTTQLNLPESCKADQQDKTCELNKAEIEKLGFVFGTNNDEKIIGVHVSKPTNNPSATLKWREITGDQSRFSFGLMFTISSKSDNLEILKAQGSTQDNEKITIPTTGMEFGVIKDGDKYYFKKLDQSDREKNAGMNCNGDGSCSLVATGTNVNGLTENHTITKVTATSETSKYPNGSKYKVSTNSLTAEDGYYKLIFPDNENKWKLERVDDLFTKWDRSVIETGTWNANENGATPKSVKVTVSGTEQKINGSGEGAIWTWECEIKALTTDPVHSLTLTEQISTLKEKLGITDTQTPLSEAIKKQRKFFVENCANNRNSEQKAKAEGSSLTTPNDKIESSITLSTTTDAQNKKFETTSFNNLFQGAVKSVGA